MYFVTKGDLPISFPHSPDCLEAYFSGQGVSTIVFFAAEQDGRVHFRKNRLRGGNGPLKIYKRMGFLVNLQKPYCNVLEQIELPK